MEFRSKLEEMTEAIELDFSPTPGFGPYKEVMPSEAVAHPAKANTLLLRFLIENFTSVGDTVLDPMAGSGSTGVVAALLGRNAVQVELERKFYEWMEKARENVERHVTLTPRGWIKNICGDARRLSELLGQADVVLTSPPYAEANRGGGIAKRGYEGKYGKDERLHLRHDRPLSDSPDNISNMPYVDTVVTSPPYTNAAAENPNVGRYRKGGKFAEEKLKGVDAVITSPPYVDGFRHNPQNAERRIQKLIEVEKRAVEKGQKWAVSSEEVIRRRYAQQDLGYGRSKGNIGNLPLGNVDAVITSPPYEGSLEGTTRHTRGGIASRDPALAQTGSYATVMSFGVPVGYSPNKDNIGNLKSEDEEYEALVDAVITSPPYAHESTASGKTRLEKQGLFKMGHSKEQPYTEEDYRKWDKHKEGNIGKRKLFIRVPCSPEEAQFHDTRRGRKGTIWEWTKEVEATSEIVERIQKLKNEKKGRSETYLEAMFKVYSEMWKVLKPGGRAIIIVKPFIRNKKVVDLPYHTWLLMARVGFELEKLCKLRLKNTSFWRVLYSKKYPKVPKINHEYILVCRKPAGQKL
jgi:DNA modification methylase